jgi:glutathionylspermidine synthase
VGVAVGEEFGPLLLTDAIGFIEPPWKMLLANKAILPILWEMFPGHPNLLAAAWEREEIEGACVEKPIYGREGADVRLVGDREIVANRPDRIYQVAAPLPQFDEWHALIGSWVIGGKAAGIGLREDRDPITRNTSRFVPHYFV